MKLLFYIYYHFRMILCSLYHSYKKLPSALIMGEGMLDVINSELGESDVLT